MTAAPPSRSVRQTQHTGRFDLYLRVSSETLPRPGDLARVQSCLQDWDEQAERLSVENPQLAEAARALARDTDGKRALEAVFGHSPFLTHCALAEVEFCVRLFDLGPSKVLGLSLIHI